MRDINEADFEKEVVKSNLPVIVDFWAPWCSPCSPLTPILHKLSEEHKEKLKFVKVNVDQNKKLKEMHSVMSLPCLVVFHNGEEKIRWTGFKSEYDLREKLRETLNK